MQGKRYRFLMIIAMMLFASCSQESQYERSKNPKEKHPTRQEVEQSAKVDDLIVMAPTPEATPSKEESPRPSATPSADPTQSSEADSKGVVQITIQSDIQSQPVGGPGYQFSLTALDGNGEDVEVDQTKVSWSMDEIYNDFGVLNDSGFMKAYDTGAFTVEASYLEHTATAEVVATEAEIVSISIGCHLESMKPFPGCKEQNLSICSGVMGSELYDFRKGVRLIPPSSPDYRPDSNQFPIFILGYKSDCSLVDLSNDKDVDVVSSEVGLDILYEKTIGLITTRHVLGIRSITDKSSIKAYYTTAGGRIFSATTPINYTVSDPR